MQVFRSVRDFLLWRRALSPNTSLGFVPTMGALHHGHMKLVEASVSSQEATVVSIFVNPLQFAAGEDFTKYPRVLDRDLELSEKAGVTAVFAPTEGDFYASDHATFCEVAGLGDYLCGASRPGHFRGVCTVVLKLFNMVIPHKAFFGQKDIQQALILKKMVLDLSLELELILVETWRESSGLAMSSRNVYLTPDEKSRAAALYRALSKAKSAYGSGEIDANVLRGILKAEIQASKPNRIDYVDVVSQSHLTPISKVDKPAVLAVAVFYGATRLIDNVLLD